MTPQILWEIFAGYTLSLDGIHGPRHWGRVLENGRKLAAAIGADIEVVELFAILHDARRENEGHDPDHGRRGAMLARELQAQGLLSLGGERLELLCHACALHTDGLTDGDPTVQACWDADRLDLPRVGITVRASRLCTPAARDRATIGWALHRALLDHEAPEVPLWLRWAAEQAP